MQSLRGRRQTFELRENVWSLLPEPVQHVDTWKRAARAGVRDVDNNGERECSLL